MHVHCYTWSHTHNPKLKCPTSKPLYISLLPNPKLTISTSLLNHPTRKIQYWLFYFSLPSFHTLILQLSTMTPSTQFSTTFLSLCLFQFLAGNHSQQRNIFHVLKMFDIIMEHEDVLVWKTDTKYLKINVFDRVVLTTTCINCQRLVLFNRCCV